ncbi:MAG TPA: FliA/WhiG family RNA polymerase sigma factor [Nocardioidaceae bacterium]|nr:FliA/WhiG family RNA polymerase sigma factor [Nocardioidaceae bacterium]
MKDSSVEEVWSRYRAEPTLELRNRLVMQYSPLVKYVAGRLRTRLPDSVDYADLVSDGIIGLMEAIDRFDPSRGLTFQTFAVPRIRGAMVDALRALDWVPRSVRERVRQVEEAQRVLEARLGRIPDDPEIAAEVGISVPTLRDLYAKVAFTSVGTLEDLELADDLSAAATHEIEDDEAKAALLRVVGELPERDQVLIALYYFEGLTLSEIGRVLGVSESRVSQLHSRATLVLRTKLSAIDAV